MASEYGPRSRARRVGAVSIKRRSNRALLVSRWARAASHRVIGGMRRSSPPAGDGLAAPAGFIWSWPPALLDAGPDDVELPLNVSEPAAFDLDAEVLAPVAVQGHAGKR